MSTMADRLYPSQNFTRAMEKALSAIEKSSATLQSLHVCL